MQLTVDFSPRKIPLISTISYNNCPLKFKKYSYF